MRTNNTMEEGIDLRSGQTRGLALKAPLDTVRGGVELGRTPILSCPLLSSVAHQTGEAKGERSYSTPLLRWMGQGGRALVLQLRKRVGRGRSCDEQRWG